MLSKQINDLWIVDDCNSVGGYWTIRTWSGDLEDVNGNLNEQPIATVYDEIIANDIVNQHNAIVNCCDAE